MGSLARLARRPSAARPDARISAGWLAAGLIGLSGLLTSPALGNEIAARSTASGIRVHGPAEVLSDYCSREEDGRIWFTVPGGATWELVTSTADPSISNPGDGSFHAFEESEVKAAMAAVRYPLEGIDVDIYLLPYPRRGALDSGAGPGLILLSPGVLPVAREQQHAEFVHELGHVVQYRWMPDSDGRWARYRELRGIENTGTFSAVSVHANRPHEIFADDFRALYGGALATYSGSIENAALAVPGAVPGLDGFLRSLTTAEPIASRLTAGANPARGPLTLALAAATDAPIDLFDVTGRRIAILEPATSGSQTLWRWSGRDTNGARVPHGMLLARLRGADRTAVRISWMP